MRCTASSEHTVLQDRKVFCSLLQAPSMEKQVFLWEPGTGRVCASPTKPVYKRAGTHHGSL